MESDAESPSIESRTQPPSFNQPVTNTLVVEGSTARFEARFSGVPPPEITWLRNGLQVIQNSKNYQVLDSFIDSYVLIFVIVDKTCPL